MIFILKSLNLLKNKPIFFDIFSKVEQNLLVDLPEVLLLRRLQDTSNLPYIKHGFQWGERWMHVGRETGLVFIRTGYNCWYTETKDNKLSLKRTGTVF